MKKLLLVLSVVAMASFLLVGCLGTTPAADEVVTIAAIPGVTAPVTGATPVTTITATAQYTGAVAWSKAKTTTFDAATVYTATITLTPVTGFTLTGVAADFFTVAGATAANLVDSGVVTAVFPATAPAPVPPTKPVITAISDQEVFWDVASWTYPVVVTAGTGTITGYSLTEKPPAMSISAAGLITWSIIPDVLAVHDVTVRVDASDGEFATETFAIEVKAPVPVPVGPTVVSLLPLVATVGEVYAGQVTATAGDNATLTYSLVGAPTGMTIVAATGVITWTPAAAGNQVVTVKVTDGAALSNTKDFTIVVAARVAPVIVAIDDQTIPWGEEFTNQVTLTAAGTDLTPTYALAATRVPNAIGLAIDAATGLITWTPLEIQNGLYEVTVTATDTYDSSLFDTEVFTIVVEDPAALSATIWYNPTHSYVNLVTYVRGWHIAADAVPVEVTVSEVLATGESLQIRWNDGTTTGDWEDLTLKTGSTLIYEGTLSFDGSGWEDCVIICVEVQKIDEDICPGCDAIIILQDTVKVDSVAPKLDLNITFGECTCPSGAYFTLEPNTYDACLPLVDDCCDECSGIDGWEISDAADCPECATLSETGCPDGTYDCGCLLYVDPVVGYTSGDTIDYELDFTFTDNVGNAITDTWTITVDTDGVVSFANTDDAEPGVVLDGQANVSTVNILYSTCCEAE